ncbi:MAG: hypothetical protein HY021_01075 [Burkholderiales bacterium]|nr:hypothetical protein [Burkholderiales bacterium]
MHNLGSRWTIEKVLVRHDSPEAVSEIRAYHAAPTVSDTATLPKVGGQGMGELVEFDYLGRGDHLRWE